MTTAPFCSGYDSCGQRRTNDQHIVAGDSYHKSLSWQKSFTERPLFKWTVSGLNGFRFKFIVQQLGRVFGVSERSGLRATRAKVRPTRSTQRALTLSPNSRASQASELSARELRAANLQRRIINKHLHPRGQRPNNSSLEQASSKQILFAQVPRH